MAGKSVAEAQAAAQLARTTKGMPVSNANIVNSSKPQLFHNQ
jgi:hypothetical protein